MTDEDLSRVAKEAEWPSTCSFPSNQGRYPAPFLCWPGIPSHVNTGAGRLLTSLNKYGHEIGNDITGYSPPLCLHLASGARAVFCGNGIGRLLVSWQALFIMIDENLSMVVKEAEGHSTWPFPSNHWHHPALFICWSGIPRQVKTGVGIVLTSVTKNGYMALFGKWLHRVFPTSLFTFSVGDQSFLLWQWNHVVFFYLLVVNHHDWGEPFNGC